ncbi:MAG: methyltransferase [Solobacterium sp.]|nr:methyltransferase [Solobacterium sp.]
MDAKHYFTDNRDLPSHKRNLEYFFEGKTYTFTADDGVFSKTAVDFGTHTLLNALLEEDPLTGSLLDLGCGYGVIGIVLKQLYPELSVTAIDVNPRAIELTEENSRQNNSPIVTAVSDGLGSVSDQRFDTIVTNPPIRAGKKTVYRMFEESYDHLSDGGRFYAVIRRNQGAESAMNKLAELFGSCDLIDRDRGYWILRCVKDAN